MTVAKHNQKGEKSSVEQLEKKQRRIDILLVFTMIYSFKLFSVIVFHLLETTPVDHYAVIHSRLDDLIPFTTALIIPYWSWFGYYNIASHSLLLNYRLEEVFRFMTFVWPIMSLYYLVSWVWPNGNDLRPDEVLGEGLNADLVRFLYSVDPPRNCTPTIHVYNTLAAMLACRKSDLFSPAFKIIHNFWGVLILVGIVTLKQHSMIDVGLSFLLAVLMYQVSYRGDFPKRMLEKFQNRKFLNPRAKC